uniref:Uncharacterized protein n=1 Tax=Streptomyces rimofaciens TaxID=504097 RepID=H9BDV7_9ACTN|nr:hypothetical protein [Streptomyces rimofaciens]
MAGHDRRGSGSGARTPRETAEADTREPDSIDTGKRREDRRRTPGGERPDPRRPREAADPDESPESAEDRRRRRAQFLRELNEAKELRDRVQPRRARAARMRQQMRMRTFRW